jgi:hypothetical protein
MPTKFASGRFAIAQCDRCGFRYKLKQLKELVIKTKNVNLLVCPTCWEPDQPQLQLGMYPVNDPQAIRNPRSDTTYSQAGLQDCRLTLDPVNLEPGIPRVVVEFSNGALLLWEVLGLMQMV